MPAEPDRALECAASAAEPDTIAAMPTRVGIVHPAELVATGLAAGLQERGYQVDYPIRAGEWVLGSGERLLVHDRRTADDIGAIQRLIRSRRGLLVVALIEQATEHAFQQAFRAGCAGAVWWDAPMETIMEVIEAAAREIALLPSAIARQMAAASAQTPPDTVWLSEIEKTALRLLAGGAKTNQIADDCGYSEREIFRMLADLYTRMGVANRSQAIATVARWGLLDDS